MIKLLLNSVNLIFQDLIFLILIISFVGLVYPSMVAFNQIDVKKIIAYSSVAHMNFSLIGLFGQFLIGLAGCFFMMLGHAITSGALFLGLGVLYDRYKTRIIFYYAVWFFLCLFFLFSILFLFFLILVFQVQLIS